ncbi:hypothetical protein [Thalassotalea litorea]|uniref:hypothetical protein n=1 Tax=Thalassotalea litorea TaxID=2020715 RepID=UPI0037366CC8
MNRAERINSYCCIGLYSSVEENNPESIHIKSTKFRDEYVWFVDMPAKVLGGGNMISNCPWCGTKLPSYPYINDNLGKGYIGPE